MDERTDNRQGHEKMDGDKSRIQFVSDNLAPEPALEGHQEESEKGGTQDRPLAAMIEPGGGCSGENEEAYKNADKPVDILDPGELEIEVGRVDMSGKLGNPRRRDPAIKTLWPIWTTESGAGCTDESTNADQQKG